MRRATTIVLAVHGFAGPGIVSPESVDRDGNANLIDAAAELGVDVILTPVVATTPEHPVELFRAKHEAERHLIASGTRWTIVRATAFLEFGPRSWPSRSCLAAARTRSTSSRSTT